jgi:hypothetical protein
MKYEYCVVEVSDVAWQEIMDSDEEDECNQHLNHWGMRGWEIVCVVPKMDNGTTVGYGIVFKKTTKEGEERKLRNV